MSVFFALIGRQLGDDIREGGDEFGQRRQGRVPESAGSDAQEWHEFPPRPGYGRACSTSRRAGRGGKGSGAELRASPHRRNRRRRGRLPLALSKAS
jgi:hypothetical protein